ncbi:MAG: hypothetical protein AAF481_09800 [Acidobacteriota bacterium]
MRLRLTLACSTVLALTLWCVPTEPVAARGVTRGPALTIDIADLQAGRDPLIRVSGAPGPTTTGRFGTPVAGGFDVDGDGFGDYAIGHMTATPAAGRTLAGEAHLVFGNGTTRANVNLGVRQSRVLRVLGDAPFEATGSEVWMGDITGDGLGDFLICRQNFSAPGKSGAGALTVVVGSPALRNLANGAGVLDLRNPPASIQVLTFVGASGNDRLGIWTRTGDVDGDGIDELVMAADQESIPGEPFRGALYIVRGGSHLATSGSVDLSGFGAGALPGQIAKVVPPPGAVDFHFGATHQLGDLDRNGRAEVLVSAAFNRAGGVLSPDGQFTGDGSGGPPGGRMWIVWDDSFPPVPWPNGFTLDLGAPPASLTTIDGGPRNVSFGEELLGGLDYDDDGRPDLFVGDLVGDESPNGDRPVSGAGYVLYRAERLRGRTFAIHQLPGGLQKTTFIGPVTGAIGSDTVAHGDFNGDGIADLMIGNPHDNPQDRFHAGSMHVFFGQRGRWPEVIDTAVGRLPPTRRVRITLIEGARGGVADPSGQGQSPDIGDTLCYSAAAGDVNGDGRTDIITNEMVGNGVGPGAVDVGNLVILDGGMTGSGRPGGHRRGVPRVPEADDPRGDGPLRPAREGRGALPLRERP